MHFSLRMCQLFFQQSFFFNLVLKLNHAMSNLFLTYYLRVKALYKNNKEVDLTAIEEVKKEFFSSIKNPVFQSRSFCKQILFRIMISRSALRPILVFAPINTFKGSIKIQKLISMLPGWLHSVCLTVCKSFNQTKA